MVIRKLPAHEAQKIAAGEVVERPAHILKELLENSIDAGATKIVISVYDGGKAGISITDNGSGMDAHDARICFERHTTSKTSSFDDLSTLTTFGFRGEALASICSVSKVTLTTRTTHAEHALQLSLEGGTLVKEQPVAHAIGTSIVIKDIFYNVPVRKKFLKATTTEWNHISSLFKAFCGVYPHIHFVLHHNDQLVLNCPPATTILERARQLFEEPVIKHLQPLTTSITADCTIQGFISSAHYYRYDRQGIYLFVNNRWVKNYELSRALLKGYANALAPSTYPCAFITINVDPLLVDINVHPKKEEVVFLHPRKIEQQVTAAVKATLEAHLSQQLQRPVTLAQPQHQPPQPWHTPHPASPFIGTLQPHQFMSKKHIDPILPEQQLVQPTAPLEQLPVAFTDTQETYLEQQQQIPYTLIGQLHKTYLIIEHPDGMLLIDQHAAHERILYEQYKTRFDLHERVQLLFPLTVALQPNERTLLEPYLPLLEQHGFSATFFAADTLVISATPVFAKSVNMQELVREMLGWITEETGILPADIFKKITEKLRAQLACKAAVKAGDQLTEEKMQELLKTLASTDNRFSCPHGRPTHWLLSTRDIEKKFKRIV